jgi:outer membrane protein OmpA-like peptidoglycan-associated protein
MVLRGFRFRIVPAAMIFAIMAGFAMTGAWALDKPKDDGINLDIIQEMPPLNDNAPAGSQADDVNPLDRDFAVALEAYRERDYTTARQMWSELSDAGHGISMHNLAVLKWRGQGGPRERAAALELFRNAGAAELLDGGKRVLTGLLPLLSAGGYMISVEGHTDSVPIATERFPSNWELSGARAASVVRELIALGIDENRLELSGFAHTRPLGDNATPAGRERNRRVNILLHASQQDMEDILLKLSR